VAPAELPLIASRRAVAMSTAAFTAEILSTSPGAAMGVAQEASPTGQGASPAGQGAGQR
jgi:hypothetical protein